MATILKNLFLKRGFSLCILLSTSLLIPPLNASNPYPTSSSSPNPEETEYREYNGEPMDPAEVNPQVVSQKAGNYSPLVRPESIRESTPLGAFQEAWDRADEGKGVYTVDYSPREIIKLRLREYMTTTISLPEWEKIKGHEIGDPVFKIKQIDSHTLNLRLMGRLGADTNLTVFGHSGQIYVFYLRSEGYNSKHISDGIVYVQAPTRLIKEDLSGISNEFQEGEEDYLEKVQSNPSDLNFDYTMAGDAEIAPDRVYTDGKKTWFDYSGRKDVKKFPSIFNVVDGIDQPIMHKREGMKLVVFKSGKFSLRLGKKTACVYPSVKEG